VCAPWPKATVKSPVGACIFTLYFLLPWTPCPALPLPCPALFRIYLLLPGTGGGSYTGNGQCFFFPFAARDRRRKLHRELFFFFFPHGRFCAFGFRDSWRWSQVRRFACGRDRWNVRPAGWMTVREGGVRGCFTKSLHI
jgi:hypothetical protein